MTYATPDPLVLIALSARRVRGACFVWPSPSPRTVTRIQRFAWTLVHGSLPAGRELRVRCGTPGCLNPWHVEAHRIAVRAGVTHCIHGHPYEEGSFYLQPNGRGGMVKKCRACARASGERYRQRKGLNVRSIAA